MFVKIANSQEPDHIWAWAVFLDYFFKKKIVFKILLHLYKACLQISVKKKDFFLFLKQNICCDYSKKPSQWDSCFEHQKLMFKAKKNWIVSQAIFFK